jgi:hypothetical protein
VLNILVTVRAAVSVALICGEPVELWDVVSLLDGVVAVVVDGVESAVVVCAGNDRGGFGFVGGWVVLATDAVCVASTCTWFEGVR